MWTFYCYDDPEDGIDIWRQWYFRERRVSKPIKARHDVVIRMLRQQPVWDDGKLVHGSPIPGVVQIVVKVQKDLQWRIGGIWGLQPREFVVLGFFYHKGTQYRPQGIKDKIERRRDEVIAGKFKVKVKGCEPPNRMEAAPVSK